METRKALFVLLFLLIAPVCSYAQIDALQGFCQDGNKKVTTQGLQSTTTVQQSYPKCTVTVYLTGTTTLATIYADGIFTPLSNPFTAKTDGSWIFWAADGTGYDVNMAGGVPPNVFPLPFTLTDLKVGNGGGGGYSVEVNGVPLAIQPPANFVNSASVTFTNPTGNQIQATAAGGGGGGCSVGGIPTTGGIVNGDVTSTNCGTNNRVNDGAEQVPANIQTFGYTNLTNNLGWKIVAVGNDNGLNSLGPDNVYIGDSNFNLAAPQSNLTYDNRNVMIGDDIFSGGNAADFFRLIDVVSIGDTDNCASVYGDLRLGDSVIIGETNDCYSGAGNMEQDNIVAIGDTSFNIGFNSTPSADYEDIIAIGDTSGNMGDGSTADVSWDDIGIGDGALEAWNVKNWIAIGERLGSGDNATDVITLGVSSATDIHDTHNVIAIGQSSLGGNFNISYPGVSGANNIGIGYYTLSGNTSGHDNIALGDNAGTPGISIDIPTGDITALGNSTVTGVENIMIGDTTGLCQPDTGTNETLAFGDHSCAIGGENIMVGDHDGLAVTSPGSAFTDNVAIGNANLQTLTGNQSEQVCIGDENCRTNDWSEENIAIGNNNLVNNTGGSLLAEISEVVVIGLSNGIGLGGGSNSIVGIGQNTCNGNPLGPGGYTEAVCLGDDAGALMEGLNNSMIAIGTSTLNHVAQNSQDLISIGDGAGQQCNSSDALCTTEGFPITQNQHDVISIGDAAGEFNQGSDVVAIGDKALGPSQGMVTTGTYNQGNQLVAIGEAAMAANTTGTKNVGIGPFAGADGFAYPATIGNANQTGSNNTWVGFDSGPNTTTQLSNTVALGYQAHNSASNQIAIGNSSMTSIVMYGCSAGQYVKGDGSGCGPGGISSPLTTKGDIWVYGSGDTRLPVGTNGFVLSANSAQPTGLQWIAALTNPMTTLGDIIYGGASGTATRLAGNTTASTLCLVQTGTGAVSAAPSWAACSGSSATALSSITAASTNATINSNNNPIVWNWAQTTNSQTAFTFGENTAASGTGDQEVAIKTIAGSTAIPLTVSESLNGAQTLPALQVLPTWNTSGVVDAAILVNVTNTASGTASKLLDLQVGGTSEMAVDKAGIITHATWNGVAITNAFLANSATTVNGQTCTLGSTCSVNLNNAATFNNSGSGAASGTTFDGSAPRTISYNTFGAAPTASPTFTGTITTPLSGGGTQCVQVNNSGVLSGTGSACGAGGGTAFSALTSGTNTTAAMLVGTGASLATTGSGTITASSVVNAVTFNNSGSGAASGTTFDGSTPRTISYNTFGAAPTASPTFTGSITTPVTGSTQCLQVNSSGVIAGSGAACGSAIALSTTGTSGLATLSSGTLNIPHYAGSGANTDITSLASLSTPLSVPQGGTGAATLTGYVFGNGTSAMTASTTIPGSAISGNIPGFAANLYGTPALPNGTTATTQAPSDNSTKLATTAYVAAPGAIAPTSITMSGGGVSRVQIPGGTYAALIAAYPCGSSAGNMATVNDSTTTTWGAAISGGGSNTVLAFCDGTAYTVVGK